MPIEEHKGHMLPILTHIFQHHLAIAKDPDTGEVAELKTLLKEAAERKGNRNKLIEYRRSLTPFRLHILDAGNKLIQLNTEVSEALAANKVDEISKGYFKIMALLVSVKLWRHMDFPIEKMVKEIDFTPEETAFLDRMEGLDLPLGKSNTTEEPVITRKIAQVDTRELWDGDTMIDGDYKPELQKKITAYIQGKYNLFRFANFSGTKVPLEGHQHMKPGKVEEEVPDLICFMGPSQFLKDKFHRLRTGNYIALDIERKETGGYNEKQFRFELQGDKLVEVEKSPLAAGVRFMTPRTIWEKLVNDVNLMQQTVTMGAKKIDKDYCFNIFYHIQQGPGSGVPDDASGMTFPRFDPSQVDDQMKHRDRITADQAIALVDDFSKCDQYVFGGHLDLDLYMDGIGIRKKPRILMIEGEGLGCFDYINNLMIIPTICPPRVSPIDQVLAAMADFRYSLWIDSPKEIFDKQGVGFALIGRKTKASSKKPLWQIFPNHASALIKQRAFREQYTKHLLSFMWQNNIKKIGGIDIPITNRIVDQKLRQFFDAYIPLKEFAPTEGVSTAAPVAGEAAAVPEPEAKPQAPAPEKAVPAPAAAPAPEKKAAPTPAPAPAPKPKPAPAPAAAPAAADDACSQCGKALPPDSKFCLECGTKVDMVLKCKKCGVELPEGSKFCNICGTPQ